MTRASRSELLMVILYEMRWFPAGAFFDWRMLSAWHSERSNGRADNLDHPSRVSDSRGGGHKLKNRADGTRQRVRKPKISAKLRCWFSKAR